MANQARRRGPARGWPVWLFSFLSHSRPPLRLRSASRSSRRLLVEFNFSRWSLGTLFHFRSKVQGHPVEERHVLNPYHAVSVRPGRYACGAVLQLQGVRFLSSDAPRLPLTGCNAKSCNCRYQHHEDRRETDRRQNDVWGSGPAWMGPERRRARGRRSTDL